MAMAWQARVNDGQSGQAGFGACCSRSKGVLWREPADTVELAFVTKWAGAQLGHGLVLSGRFEIGRGNWLGGRRICLVELQTQAHLSDFGAFGRMPEAKVANLVQSLGENMLKETAHELVAR